MILLRAILYGLLGLMLGVLGTRPDEWAFWITYLIVMGVEVVGYFQGKERKYENQTS